jgi:hypothetical protein
VLHDEAQAADRARGRERVIRAIVGAGRAARADLQRCVGCSVEKLTPPARPPAVGAKLTDEPEKRSVPMPRRLPAAPGAESGMPSRVRAVCDSSWLCSEICTGLFGSVASLVTETPASLSSASVSESESRRIGLSALMSLVVMETLARAETTADRP